MRDYGKVHTTFWSSTSMRELTEDGRMLALYLLTCPHGTITGVFRLPDGYACEDLQWDAERVRKGFDELLRNGFANRCETTKWVWVTKHLEWNSPENPNQRKSAAKVASQVPEKCGWRLDFMRVCGPLLGLEAPSPDNPCRTVKKPFPNQEQEQEQEQDKKEADASLSTAGADDDGDAPDDETDDDDGLPACPHREILALFAERLPELPQPKPELWDGQRAKNLTARWRWCLNAKKGSSGERYATDKASALAFFARFFAFVAKSDFLTGRDGRWTGCDLAWLVKADNFAKVMQGNYENREAA